MLNCREKRKCANTPTNVYYYRIRRPKTQRQLREEKTTHTKHGGTVESNIRRTIQKRSRSNLDIRNRPRLCIRANGIGT